MTVMSPPVVFSSPASDETEDDERSLSTSTLWVFDLDGTLLVSHGREIIEVDGMRAGIHPLIEAHVRLPSGRSSDFRYCGEEDLHGDPHSLIETAAVIEPVANVLRRARNDGSEVAILSARAHDARWLSERLTRKLGLKRPIRPELIQCVYSATFEAEICDKGTPERKAAALEVLIRRSRARAVHFFDDVKENLDFAVDHFNNDVNENDAAEKLVEAKQSATRVYPHLVDFDHSLEALAKAGVEPADVFHPQLRHERVDEPNALVLAIKRQLSYSNLKTLQRLAEAPPPTAVVVRENANSSRHNKRNHHTRDDNSSNRGGDAGGSSGCQNHIALPP